MFLMLKLEYFPPTLADSELDSVFKERIDLLCNSGKKENRNYFSIHFTDITEYMHFFCEIEHLEETFATKKSLPILSSFSFKATF